MASKVCDTEVSDLVSVSSGSGFVQELCAWWSRRCLAMGKSHKRDSENSGGASPPKLSKVTDGNSAGESSQSDTNQPDMLSTLVNISSILQNGFDSLKSKVGEVGSSIDKLEDKMDKKLDALVVSEPELDSEEEVIVPANGNDSAKRQGDHELSDGEVVDKQSPVLTATLKALNVDESVGPPVRDIVADFVKEAYAKPVRGDNAKKFKDRLSIPKNIDCLSVPRVNEPIYIKLAATPKNKDRAIQDSQVSFMKMVSGLVRITDILTEHEGEGDWVGETMQLAADAITISAPLQEDWLKSRREDIKPSLPDDFKRLASVEIPMTAKNLFGDDLEGSIKSVENTNKLANKMEVKKPKPTNYNNNKGYKNQYKKKKKFNNNNNNKDKGNKKDFQKRGSKN